MELKKLKLEYIIPYENNPRLNDKAVDAVVESIKQCTYISPIMVDEDYIVLIGHTRLKALKKLGYTECDCIVKSGMTEVQKRKYRILDNKTSELADWDMDLLINELEYLDLGDFHYFDDIFEVSENTESAAENKADSNVEVRCPKCGGLAHKRK